MRGFDMKMMRIVVMLKMSLGCGGLMGYLGMIDIEIGRLEMGELRGSKIEIETDLGRK